MLLKRISYKTLAVFVLAFLCFNLGGALCLTACSQLFSARQVVAGDAQLSEHCKQAKRAAEAIERDSTKIEAGEASCCMMPVSLFAAPFEKKSEFKVALKIAKAPAEVLHDFSIPIFHSASLPATPVYRPPPIDGRNERILHSVFRI